MPQNRLNPATRPALQPHSLIAALAAHQVNWVLAGSEVLRLHGADLVPNDLDVVPDLTPENLQRLAACLTELNAVAAYLDGWGGARGTYEACLAWRPEPPTKEHLDWLFVTEFGMLDIVIALAEPYAEIMRDAQQRRAGDVSFWMADPRRVLTALEGRRREKDAKRAFVYAAMRRRFGMPRLKPATRR